MDKVFVHGLKVRGKHGVHAHERLNEQEFLIDIEADFDATKSAASDDIVDTVNYSEFVKIAEQIVTTQSFYLIEKLATTIAERILQDERTLRVEVSVRKPAVFASGVPGVTIERSRA